MLKILLVEDNLGDQALFTEALDDAGIECKLMQANSAQGSLNMLYNNKPDLVIMDINLPGLSGSEFVALFQNGPEATRSQKVIFLTGAEIDGYYYDLISKEILVREKKYPVLKKPVNSTELKKIIDQQMKL